MKSLPKNTGEFSEHFRDYSNSYVLIGGVATLFHLEGRTGVASRVTRDLDIVVLDLSDDPSSSAFLKHFEQYVKTNGYSCHALGSGKPQNYRFTDPSSGVAPKEIEIISRRFNWTPEKQGTQRITDTEMSSIALSPQFYDLAKAHRKIHTLEELGVSPVPIAIPTALILLKAYAYENLMKSERKDDRSKAPKHVQDIARLASVLTDDDKIQVSDEVYSPLRSILLQADQHFPTTKLTNLGWSKRSSPSDVVNAIEGKISTR